MDYIFELVFGALTVILVSGVWAGVVNLAWKPYATKRKFTKQGVRGPNPKFWSGSLHEISILKNEVRNMELNINDHDVVPRVLPHYSKWIAQYGETFFYMCGSQLRVCVTDIEHVKQVLSNKFGYFTKPDAGEDFMALLGKGLVLTVGEEWARHRRVVSPAFSMDKLKVMTKKMAECTMCMLDNWSEHVVQANGKNHVIEVAHQFQELTADIISHSAFGSSSTEGKDVFLAQGELQINILSTILDRRIPGYKYLPTKKNRERKRLDKKIRNTLTSIIQNRHKNAHLGYGNDLLGLMMESTHNQESKGLNMEEIIDNCKTFFFAGHETTSHLLTWTMFLLSTNKDWQENVRNEVVNECGRDIPSADNLSKLKLVNMVLLEVLRLYSPVSVMVRETTKDMNLGSLTIPKNSAVSLPIAIIHRKKELWGDDADQFNPMRFENGIARAAKHPNALLAFSMGPRACVGQNFAMLEAKMVVALILQRFSFSISHDYKHMPADLLTLQPQLGVPIVVESLLA